jgi:uncharacterized membrane protein
MSLSYWVRLVSVCFASFFVVHACASAVVWLTQRWAVRFAERLAARTAARFVLALRFLPFGIALASVLGLCAPSYLRFEENLLAEHVGPICLAMAMLGIVICVAALDRGLHSVTSSIEFARICGATGHTVRLRGKPSRMVVIPGTEAFLAQVGILRPLVVISQRLLRELSPDELAAALSHERAHWIARDNLKRLLLAFLPDVLPLWPSLKQLQDNWAKFAERAADDYVLTAGEAPAVSLASALVRLAQIGVAHGSEQWASVATSPLGGSDDLSGRVDRLLRSGPEPQPRQISALLSATTFFAACCLMAVVWPTTLSTVHELLEFLIH